MKPFDTSIQVTPTEFIGGLFPRGYVSVIVGPPGTGKSLVVQKIFTDLSNGGKFLAGSKGDGATCFKDNEQQRKCIILCGELGEQGLRERATTFNLHPNPQNVIVLDQTSCEANGYSFMLNTPKGHNNLEFIAQTRPDILFIDSFSAFFTGKENDNSECNEVFGYLRRVAHNHNLALVITHHSRKRGTKEQNNPLTLDDVVGAQAITRHVYSVIAIEYMQSLKLIKISSLKCWGKKFDPFGYSIKYDIWGHPYIHIDLAPGEIDEDKLNTNTSNTGQKQEWQILIRCYLLGKGKDGATVSEILKAIGAEACERGTYNTRLKRMADDGEIVRVQKGRYALPEHKLIQPENDAEYIE